MIQDQSYEVDRGKYAGAIDEQPVKQKQQKIRSKLERDPDFLYDGRGEFGSRSFDHGQINSHAEQLQSYREHPAGRKRDKKDKPPPKERTNQ